MVYSVRSCHVQLPPPPPAPHKPPQSPTSILQSLPVRLQVMENAMEHTSTEAPASGQFEFAPISAEQMGDETYQRITVPPHRYTPLKQHWMEIYQPIVEHMKLQIRFNPRKRCVELRVSLPASTQLSFHCSPGFHLTQTSPETVNTGAMTKSADFVRAFLLGFEIRVFQHSHERTPGLDAF